MANDKVAQCGATIPFGDDEGDNDITFRCQRAKGHDGKHRERGKIHPRYPYALEWDGDLRDEMTSLHWYVGEKAGRDAFMRIADAAGLTYEIEKDVLGGEMFGWYARMDGHTLEKYRLLAEKDRMEGDASCPA